MYKMNDYLKMKKKKKIEKEEYYIEKVNELAQEVEHALWENKNYIERGYGYIAKLAVEDFGFRKEIMMDQPKDKFYFNYWGLLLLKLKVNKYKRRVKQ